jgi:iron(III) transport system permease protein
MSPSRGVGLHRLGGRLGVTGLVVVVGFLFIWPVAMLLIGVFRSAPPGVPGTWTADAITATFGDAATWTALRNSLLFAITSTALATIIGGFLAFLSTRTTIPLRGIITPVMILVLVAPSVLYAVSWALLADPNSGLLNSTFRDLTGQDGALLNAYSWPGIILVQSLKLSGFAYLLLLGPFKAMSRTLEEASLVAAGRVRTLFRIDLPLLTPSLFGVVIIGVVFGMGTFDVPLILGDPAGINVISTEIFKKINLFPPEYAQASALGLFMIAVLVLIMLAQWSVLRVGRFATVTGKNYQQGRWNLGKAGYVCSGALVLFVIVVLVLPGTQLILTSLQPAIGVNNFSLDNYEAILSSPRTERAFRTTAWLAVLGGLLAMTLATLLAYVARHSRVALQRYLDSATLMPIVMPGVVLAVGLLWAYISTPGLRQLYATFWLALLALVVAVMPIASRSISGALVQLAGELEEAAAMSGAHRARILRDIVVPLIAPSFMVGWLVTGVVIAGTLDIPLLLLPANEPNIAVRVFALMFSAGRPTEASALLVLLMVGVAAAAVAFLLVSRVLRITRTRLRRPVPPDRSTPVATGRPGSPPSPPAVTDAVSTGDKALVAPPVTVD